MRHAYKDISDAITKRDIAFVFGWQDVAQRYQRSRIGAFWLTINMSVLIAALGLIFGTLFNLPLAEFLPQVAAGLIVWTFITSVIAEGSTSFIASEGIILQVRLPFFIHVMRAYWRNVIILGHNLLIVPLVLLVLLQPPNWSLLLLPFGFALVSLNVIWMALFLSVFSTRFRDVPLVVQNILQVFFYATPIMWSPPILPAGPAQLLLIFNPFYHLLSLIRMPLLGSAPSLTSWAVCIGLAIVGWLAALFLLDRYRDRISYWL